MPNLLGSCSQAYLVIDAERGERSVFLDAERAMQSAMRVHGVRIPLVPDETLARFSEAQAVLVSSDRGSRVFLDAGRAHDVALQESAMEIPLLVDPAWTEHFRLERLRG